MCDKKDLRRSIFEKKQKFLQEEFYLRESKALFQEVEKMAHFKKANIVMAYWSLWDEPYTHEFLEKWYVEKTLLLPVIQGDNMILHPYQGMDNMRKGKYGISEPITNDFKEYEFIDMALVPGVAFDHKNNRMGRGKGYYDRFLATPSLNKDLYKLGICFDFQMLESLPVSKWDIPMDDVLYKY